MKTDKETVTDSRTVAGMNVELWRYIMRLQSQETLSASEAAHLAFWQAQLGL